MSGTGEHGFSIIEVLVASATCGIAAASLAGLIATTDRLASDANHISMATIVARQKMEELRSLGFVFDTNGVPVTDAATDTVRGEASTTGGTGLGPSPAGALSANTPGYVDFLDGHGRVITAVTPMTTVAAGLSPSETAYIRRWSIDPLPADPDHTLVMQVRVMPLIGARSGAVGARAVAGEVWLAGVRTRKAM
jgi:hypothetical protein